MAVKKRRGRARLKFRTQTNGPTNQLTAAQHANGQRNGLVKLDQWSRNAIRTQPYATALAVFGAGWFLGKRGRFLGGKAQGAAGLLGGKTRGLGGLLGHNTQPWASIALRILATALVDIGAPGR